MFDDPEDDLPKPFVKDGYLHIYWTEHTIYPDMEKKFPIHILDKEGVFYKVKLLGNYIPASPLMFVECDFSENTCSLKRWVQLENCILPKDLSKWNFDYIQINKQFGLEW